MYSPVRHACMALKFFSVLHVRAQAGVHHRPRRLFGALVVVIPSTPAPSCLCFHLGRSHLWISNKWLNSTSLALACLLVTVRSSFQAAHLPASFSWHFELTMETSRLFDLAQGPLLSIPFFHGHRSLPPIASIPFFHGYRSLPPIASIPFFHGYRSLSPIVSISSSNRIDGFPPPSTSIPSSTPSLSFPLSIDTFPDSIDGQVRPRPSPATSQRTRRCPSPTSRCERHVRRRREDASTRLRTT